MRQEKVILTRDTIRSYPLARHTKVQHDCRTRGSEIQPSLNSFLVLIKIQNVLDPLNVLITKKNGEGGGDVEGIRYFSSRSGNRGSGDVLITVL